MFLDIHTHLLPHIDDSKATMPLLKSIFSNYERYFIDTVVFTPHLFNPFVHTNIPHIQKTYEECSALAATYGITTYLGSEVFVKDEEDALYGLPIDNRYLFIETSTQCAPVHFTDKIQKSLDEGYGVILAHLEKYPWLSYDNELFEQLNKMGVIFQVTANAINTAKAQEYLQRGLVDVFATGNHGLLDEPQILSQAYASYPLVAEKTKLLHL